MGLVESVPPQIFDFHADLSNQCPFLKDESQPLLHWDKLDFVTGVKRKKTASHGALEGIPQKRFKKKGNIRVKTEGSLRNKTSSRLIDLLRTSAEPKLYEFEEPNSWMTHLRGSDLRTIRPRSPLKLAESLPSSVVVNISDDSSETNDGSDELNTSNGDLTTADKGDENGVSDVMSDQKVALKIQSVSSSASSRLKFEPHLLDDAIQGTTRFKSPTIENKIKHDDQHSLRRSSTDIPSKKFGLSREKGITDSKSGVEDKQFMTLMSSLSIDENSESGSQVGHATKTERSSPGHCHDEHRRKSWARSRRRSAREISENERTKNANILEFPSPENSDICLTSGDDCWYPREPWKPSNKLDGESQPTGAKKSRPMGHPLRRLSLEQFKALNRKNVDDNGAT